MEREGEKKTLSRQQRLFGVVELAEMKQMKQNLGILQRSAAVCCPFSA